ncbi:HBS1 [Mytilus edulis]|uniref:HBS1 n=1 Tax=Mytilus edulis TaxID=6550 RepID=A0A8S3SHV3_MYTED|nr:HBS1 [Mytilus edulis]
MSRHRNVRSMNYEEDFLEDDDYLGHSVEDNYCISPGTAAQFTFNRGERNVNLSSYVEENIPEEDEGESDEDTILNHSAGTPRLQLNETDQAKLNSCLDEVRNVLGESCPEHIMAQTVVKHNYNIQSTLNELLNQTGTDAPKPQRQPRESRRNKSQAGSSECLSTTPDGQESGIRKREKYPSTGSSDYLSCTPDEPSVIELANQNSLSSKQSALTNVANQSAPSLSALASQKGVSNLNKDYTTDNHYHVTELESKLSGVEIGHDTLKGKLTDLNKMNPSGSGKQFSLAEIAKDSSIQVRQPSLAELTNSRSVGVSKQPSLAELASSQSTRTSKQPSLAELASSQSIGTTKQPSLAELANVKHNTAKQLSLSDLALPSKRLPSKPSKQPGTVNFSSQSTDSQNSGKNVSSLAALSKPARSSSNEVKPSQGDNFIYNLDGLKISDLNKESNISLTDLAGKKIVKSVPKVSQTVKKRKETISCTRIS